MSDGAKVVARPVQGPKGQFQSEEARKAAMAPEPEVDDGVVRPALIGPAEVPRVAAVADLADLMKPVRARAREYIPPFRYGSDMYTLPAGKEVFIPLCVKLHLEEKNLL